MDISILQKAGLTEPQAKAYLALIENGPLTPADLADKTGESRTNGYMIADKLAAYGLAVKTDAKKVTYQATHPSNVALLAEKRRKAIVRNEQAVQSGLDSLITYFYEHSEQPGTRTLEGIDGIKQIYTDTLKTTQSIYLLRTTADIPSLGETFLDDYRYERAKRGIHTYALTPHSPEGQRHADSGEDEKLLFHRTWLPDQAYTAPVEIDIYDDKVAFIAFGGTQMATIIDSPLIAEAMRQVVKLMMKQTMPPGQIATHDGPLAAQPS